MKRRFLSALLLLAIVLTAFPMKAAGTGAAVSKRLSRILCYDEFLTDIRQLYFYYNDEDQILEIAEKIYSESGPVYEKTLFSYDENGRLLSITPGEEGTNGAEERQYCYDQRGALIEERRHDDRGETRLSYAYDALGRCIRKEIESDQETGEITCHYDQNSRLTKTVGNMSDPSTGEVWTETTEYSYDSQNRVCRKDQTGRWTETRERLSYEFQPFTVSYVDAHTEFSFADLYLGEYLVLSFSAPELVTDEDGFLISAMDSTYSGEYLIYNFVYEEYTPQTSVSRIYGADRYQTAFQAADTLKAELGVSKFDNIVVASGTGFADALSGSCLAAVKKAPILLVRPANVKAVQAYIKANLKSGGSVYLLGGENAVPKAMETGLDSFTVKRLGGADRYATNLLILKEAGVGSKDIIVCTGTNFADSLSASATGLPILLVKAGLSEGQKQFLADTSGKKIIVGGKAAVSEAVEKQLVAYGTVTRLSGANRYETSVLVANTLFCYPRDAVIAYAQNFPDGLSGGPLAYALGVPLILTADGKENVAVQYAAGLGIKSGYVLGGPGLIPDAVVAKVFSIN